MSKLLYELPLYQSPSKLLLVPPTEFQTIPMVYTNWTCSCDGSHRWFCMECGYITPTFAGLPPEEPSNFSFLMKHHPEHPPIRKA